MGTSRRAFLVTCAFIGASGCAVGPDYDPPVVAVPNAFGEASLTPAIAGAPAPAGYLRWWQVMHDPQLDRLIERAIASNPDIDIALTRVQEARSQEIVVFGGMLPSVGGSGTAAAGTGTNVTRGRIAQSIAAGDDARGVRQIERMAGFDAEWELDLFGKSERALAAAHNDAEAKLELRNAVLTTVIADVVRTYLNIRALQMRRELVRMELAMAQRSVELAIARFHRAPSSGAESKQERKSPQQETKSPAPNEADLKKLGAREPKERTQSSKQENSKQENSKQENSKQDDEALQNELSLTLAQSDLATRQARLPELAAAISASESRLALLLGTYAADIDREIRGSAKLPKLPERLRPGAPVDLLRRRPDIRAAERELAAATERIGVKTADLFPSVALTAGYGGQGTNGRSGNMPPQINGPIWSVGPRAYWPLLDFGRLDALINIEEMRTHEALVTYKKTIVAAVEEVDQAVRQYHLDLHRWKALAAAAEELRRGVDLTMERYRRGEEGDLRPALDVARRYYLHADQAAIAAESAVLRYVDFYKALGGGWELYDELPPVPPAQPAIVAAFGRLTGWH